VDDEIVSIPVPLATVTLPSVHGVVEAMPEPPEPHVVVATAPPDPISRHGFPVEPRPVMERAVVVALPVIVVEASETVPLDCVRLP